MDFLRNLVINLKATGPAAVVAVWFICIALLGIFGGPNSGLALGIISGGGILILTALIKSSDTG
ncbi:hypothetical protein ACQR09_32625 [Bradyrhizobium oligotrophicum]|uniref:hypothetical protein n=1 Tax=Bradyrhizobium oligotrophicum TaxID=44255 RepID=UPI003EBFE99E